LVSPLCGLDASGVFRIDRFPPSGEEQAIGRSRGGLSTKIRTLTDALSNPIGFFLTGGQAHDLVGADHLLADMQADILIADKAFDADERVIPPKANRRCKRTFDRHLYAARHLTENFFAKFKQFGAIATRYDKTARNFLAAVYLPASTIWQQFSFCRICNDLAIGCDPQWG
jgi:transposase